MPQPLKILQIGKHFDPDTGGIETVTAALSEALVPHGIVADVLCMGLRGGDYPPVERAIQVMRHTPEVQIGNKTVSIGYMRDVAKLQPGYDAAVLHLPNPVGMLAAVRAWRKPLLLLWHADIPQAGVRVLLAPLDRRAIAQACQIIVPTPVHASGSHLAEMMRGKTAVAPYPFDNNRLATAATEGDAWQRLDRFIGSRRLVLAVGRLVPYKGFANLIDAAVALPDRLAVVIVGTGGLQGELATQIAALGLFDRVLLAGRCEDAVLSALFTRAAIFCLPSITNAEMYGVVQVEALACGVPIVSTAIPRSGVSWVNRDGVSGIVVPVGQPDALAAAITRIATDDALHARLSAGASALFAETHDMTRAGARYAAIIREAVGVC